MKRLWWISLLLQSVLGVVPVIRYKVTDGTKEDSYIGNIGMVIFEFRSQKWPFLVPKLANFNQNAPITTKIDHLSIEMRPFFENF